MLSRSRTRRTRTSTWAASASPPKSQGTTLSLSLSLPFSTGITILHCNAAQVDGAIQCPRVSADRGVDPSRGLVRGIKYWAEEDAGAARQLVLQVVQAVSSAQVPSPDLS
eukprot:2180954-Rhodomonas_salina.1